MQGKRALSWHKSSVWELVDACGLGGTYPTFYKKASSVAHGDGFIGTGFKDGKWFYNVAELSADLFGDLGLEFSYPIMVLLFEQIVPAVKFDAEKELQAAVQTWKNIYTKFIEDKDNQTGQAVQSGGETTGRPMPPVRGHLKLSNARIYSRAEINQSAGTSTMP